MMKVTREMRVLAIALSVVCAVAFMPFMSSDYQADAASKLKVSVTSANITVGDSVAVKATGLSKKKLKKVKWSSSKKSVATVSKSKGAAVTIKAKKKGTAKITAKYGKTKVKITIKVKAKPAPKTVVKTVEKKVPSNNTTVNPSKFVKDEDVSVTGYYQGDATIYALLYQESAEVAALQMQAFKLARIQIDKRAEEKGGYDKLAIVSDIDSAIADDTCYVAGAVLDATGRMSVKYFGDMLEPWVNDDWCGYYEAVATTADTPLPGALEFSDYTYDKGVEWYYITNRPYYELDLTVKQLEYQGFLKEDYTDIVEKYAFLSEDPDGEGPFKTYQDYYYYGDPELGKKDDDGWMRVYDEAAYTNALNNSDKVEMTCQSYSVKDDYRVQVQGTDFDSDKGYRRDNAHKAAAANGREVVMYIGDSINDMVSDYETKYPDLWGGTDRWDGHGADFTRKQFNDTRTANASNDYWKDHWGEDFIVLPNATYGDWYKTTWAKGKDPDKKYDEKTAEGQQHYIYDQIWAHSYKNPKFSKWYEGVSPVTNDVQ